jgi:1-pyrroline-5-carboxylate dehydrogenase
LCGGIEPTGWLHGNWLEPALLTGAHPQSEIVQKETFGPVAVIQEAANLQQAIELANAVPHGLIAGLISQNTNAHRHFLDMVEAGIIKLRPGPLTIHPEAPFGGWKASGSTGKAIGSYYYVPQYLREQSRTVVEP